MTRTLVSLTAMAIAMCLGPRSKVICAGSMSIRLVHLIPRTLLPLALVYQEVLMSDRHRPFRCDGALQLLGSASRPVRCAPHLRSHRHAELHTHLSDECIMLFNTVLTVINYHVRGRSRA